MRIKEYLLILVVITPVTTVLAKERYSLVFRLNSGLSGSTINGTDSSLQPYGGMYEKSVEGQYLPGAWLRSIFFGVGYAHLEKNYRLFLNGVGPSLDYKLSHNYIYGRVGYPIILGDFSIRPSLKVGSGNYTFKGDRSVRESGSAMTFGVDINLQGSFVSSSFFYQVGLGYTKGSYSGIKKNGVEIGSDEMSHLVSLNLGGGYTF